VDLQEVLSVEKRGFEIELTRGVQGEASVHDGEESDED
jgi:hypothetical protein